MFMFRKYFHLKKYNLKHSENPKTVKVAATNRDVSQQQDLCGSWRKRAKYHASWL